MRIMLGGTNLPEYRFSVWVEYTKKGWPGRTFLRMVGVANGWIEARKLADTNLADFHELW